MAHKYYVYILASERNGTLYIGVTNGLSRQYFEHLHNQPKSFNGHYKINRLVYAEVFGYIDIAIIREKTLKKWNRAWKIRLIEEANPDWRDLLEPL